MNFKIYAATEGRSELNVEPLRWHPDPRMWHFPASCSDGKGFTSANEDLGSSTGSRDPAKVHARTLVTPWELHKSAGKRTVTLSIHIEQEASRQPMPGAGLWLAPAG